MTVATRTPAPGRLAELLALRTRANADFFAAEHERIARLCHLMAERFARGGRLVAVGRSPAARFDVRHVAVEFVHPVIAGKRALPALGLTREGGSLALQAELLAEPDDVVIAFGAEIGDRDTLQVIVTRSEHVPRIQEAQASGYHWPCTLLRANGG